MNNGPQGNDTHNEDDIGYNKQSSIETSQLEVGFKCMYDQNTGIAFMLPSFRVNSTIMGESFTRIYPFPEVSTNVENQIGEQRGTFPIWSYTIPSTPQNQYNVYYNMYNLFSSLQKL